MYVILIVNWSATEKKKNKKQNEMKCLSTSTIYVLRHRNDSNRSHLEPQSVQCERQEAEEGS